MSEQEETDKEEPQIDRGRQEMAREYARHSRILLGIEFALGTAYLLVLLISGMAVRLQVFVDGLGGGFLSIAAYLIVIYFAYSVLTLPLGLGGHRLALRYGLSTQNSTGWLIDWLKGLGITLLFSFVLVEILYYVIPLYPSSWWLIMAAVIILFAAVLANLAPVILVPLFYRLKPIENGELADRLVEMSARAGARVRGVYRIDLSRKTTAANAALMGLGNTRRVVLGDTLLDRYAAGEIETIYAHELGHHVHADIPVLIGVQAVSTLVGLFVAGRVVEAGVAVFGIESVAEVASLPLFALVLGALGIIGMPVTNWISRWLENRADLFALEFTGKPRDYRNALVRLCNQNLAELYPNRFVEFLLYDHPAIGHRIRLAEAFITRYGSK